MAGTEKEVAVIPAQPASRPPEDLAEIVALVAHEFNNYLNGMLLQVALLEQQLPAGADAELKTIRKLGTEAAALVRRLQQYNRSEQPPREKLDLNGLLQRLSTEWTARTEGPRVELDLEEGLPPVLAAPATLSRIVHVLIKHSMAVTPAKELVSVRTRRGPKGVVLTVADSGPPIPDDLLSRAFEPFLAVRGSGEETALAAARVLARRLRAAISVENNKDRGACFNVELATPE
jgi:signal transduction histidine kinase